MGPGVRVTSAVQPVACCPGIQFTHVLSGAFTLRVAGRLQVVRGDGGRMGSPESVEPSTEVVLRAGDTAVYADDLPTTYANPETTSAHLVSWKILNRLPLLPAMNFVDPKGQELSPAPPLPPGPLTVTLQQALLAPDGILPAPPSGAFRIVMAGLAVAPLETARDGSVQNRGRAPVVVYALTVGPVGSKSGTLPLFPATSDAR